MTGTSHHPDARYGRMGDTMIAHVTPGEQIVPKQVLEANPALARVIAQAIKNAGADPQRYRVGEHMSRNPSTGNPEFGFFSSKLWKAVQKIAPVVAGYAVGGPVGAAIGGGVGSAVRGGDLTQILQGASYGYGGATAFNAGANALNASGAFGTPSVTGATLTGGAAPTGSAASASSLGGTVAGTTQSALGAAGSSLYDSAMAPMSTVSKILEAGKLAGSLFGSQQQQDALGSQAIGNPTLQAAEAPYSPVKPEEMARPDSLNEFATYAPDQERSALATKGVNTGLGQDEQSYYRNLIQRSLIGDGNQVNVSNPNFLMPIESQYFSRQGLNTSDPMKFLQGISS